MGGSIDDLQVGHAPIGQQRRPRLGPPGLAPNLEQRHAVIDLGVLAEPRAGGGAAMVLQPSQMPHVIARRGPQFPGRDAAAVPGRIAVGMRVAPQIAMPAEPEHRLPTYAAIARASGMGLFAKRGGWRAKAKRRTRGFPAAAPPHPTFRCAAQCRERAGELVGADRMLPPIGFDGASRGRRDERAGERVPQHGRRKDRRQIAPQARQRLGVSLRAPRGRGHRSDLGWAVVATILPAKRCRFVATAPC